MNDSDQTTAGEVFRSALADWRQRRRLTKQALAQAMGFDRSYISHVESGRHPASADFARKAEAALSAGGEIWRTWQETGGVSDEPAMPIIASAPGGLVVERDHAELRYDGERFTATMRRSIVNTGPDPVIRYLMRISVDRHPGDPVASNRLYRRAPLTFDELALTARRDGEPMAWQPKLDRDSFKEVWLRFENGHGMFPLYPGERAGLEYAYTVGDDKWGPWFQRAVRLPTARLSVRLVFPAELRATVWGTETSATAEATPLHTPIARRRDDGADVFEWSIAEPPLNARYRLEWRFRIREGRRARPPEPRSAGDRMTAAGIVQRTDPALTAVAAPFALPAQADYAQLIIDELLSAVQRVREHYVFGNGMGLAAPQIGVGRAAAVVQPPDPASDPFALLNPRVISHSQETEEQYEGCLSFFDVRGLVPRPLRLEVEHTTLAGERVVTVFTDCLARLVAHEIDHLDGRLYTDRMRDGVQPISVADYKQAGMATGYDR
ncbi:MAG: peptide deformylase [Actinomadura sp.]